MIVAPFVGKGYHAIRVLVNEGRLRWKLLMKYGKVELTPPSPRDIPQIRSGLLKLLSGFQTGRWKELSSKKMNTKTNTQIMLISPLSFPQQTRPSIQHSHVHPSQQMITQPESRNANHQKPLLTHRGYAWSWLVAGCSRSETTLLTPPNKQSLLISSSITSFSHAPIQKPNSHSSIPAPALKTEVSNVSVQIPTGTSKTVLSKSDSPFSTNNQIVLKTEITSTSTSETEVNKPLTAKPVLTEVIAPRTDDGSTLVSNSICIIHVPEAVTLSKANSIDMKTKITPENVHHLVPKQKVLEPDLSNSLEVSRPSTISIPVIEMTPELTRSHVISSSFDIKELGEYNSTEVILRDSSHTSHQDGIVVMKTLFDASNISVPFEAKDGIKNLDIVHAAHLPVIDGQLKITDPLVQLESVNMSVATVVNIPRFPTVDYQPDVSERPFTSSAPRSASRKQPNHVTGSKLTDPNSNNRRTPQRSILKENKMEITTPLDALNIKPAQSKTEVTVKKLNVDQHHETSQNRKSLKRGTRMTCPKSTDVSKSNGRPLQQTRQLYPDTLRPLDNPKEALQQCFQQLNHTGCRHWEMTMQGLTTLVRLTRHHPTLLHGPNLHTAVVAVVKQVRNLRSQIARAACQVSGKLLTAFKRALDPDLEEIVGALLHRSADTNKFLRADSNAALDVMLESCSPAKIVQTIVIKGANHKNATVRAVAARLLISLTTKLGPDRVLASPREIRDKIILTGANMLTDSNLETRSYAKEMFRSMSTRPSFCAALNEVVPTQILKNIKKTILTLI